jgi:hypothetical protein
MVYLTLAQRKLSWLGLRLRPNRSHKSLMAIFFLGLDLAEPYGLGWI